MMRNSASERSFKNSLSDSNLAITDDDDDIEDRRLINKRGKRHVDSDGTETDDSDGAEGGGRGSPRAAEIVGSTVWPQSYRQSIDILSNVASPNLSSFLGSPSLSKLTSSVRDVSSFLKLPLQHKTATEEQEYQHHQIQHQQDEITRKSSHYQMSLEQIPEKIPEKTPEESKLVAYAHGTPFVRKCNSKQGVLNGVNVLCGVGILSTPYAIKEGGWGGIVILLLFAVVACYTGVLLGKCLGGDKHPRNATYPDIGGEAFGTVGRIFISIVLYVELYACCIEYLILEGDNLSSLFPGVELHIGTLHLNSHVCFAILTTLIVIPTTWLRDLSWLSYISALGVLASILVVLCLFWAGTVDRIGFHSGGNLLNLSGLPIAIGLYGYCYSGHGVFPNIYSSLKENSEYKSVIFTSIGFCTVLFAGTAIIGYMMFGESTQSQFTLNMPHNLAISWMAVWTTVANPITKFALTMTPVALSLEELLPENLQTQRNAMLLRSALVISALLVALSVPFFGLIMALVGSLLTMLVTFILPCACYLKIEKDVNLWEVIMCYVIIVIGAFCAVVGTYYSVSEIIGKY